MKTFIKAIAAGLVGFAAMGMTAASAKDYRPDRCSYDHDHRSHAANYYDYYPGDRYYSGAYDRRNRSGVSFSVTFGDRGYDDYRYRDRYRSYDNGYRHRGRRVVSRRVLDTRFRARIVVKEEIVHRRRGPRLICTVTPRGPEADYVPYRRLKRVARNHCSPRARVRIYA